MIDTTHAVQEPPAGFTTVGRAEAARYALLRRLAPSMRHHLVVNLQPIGMIYEVMDRRLRAPDPDLAQVQQAAGKINGFARAALDSCLDVVTWLAPEENASIAVAEGVRECVALLATSLSFRGYAVLNEIATVPGEVRRSAIRNVLTATLMHVTDKLAPPADLVLTAWPGAEGLLLTLTLRPTQGSGGFANEASYRHLDWDDVQALAVAERVQLEREGSGIVRMAIPWAPGHAA
jgi:hypothetical protein